MKKINLTIGMFLLISIFLMVGVFAEESYCCEKFSSLNPSENGAFCQNAPQVECDTDSINEANGEKYKAVATSCESTSYCKLGTCVSATDGICMPNTPQIVCQIGGGFWKQEAIEDIPQCELGCCLLGDQAAFVSQTKCSKLASEYSLEVDFRTDIKDEVSCIMSAGGQEKGACVFEEGFVRTCRMNTKDECDALGASGGDVANVIFHEGFLCSAEQLGTECGFSKDTTCVEGKEDVYFIDSCGNVANIYDADKAGGYSNYWEEIQEPDCDKVTSSSGGAETCGDCDYESGSICTEYKFGADVKPEFGNFYCKDLSCEFDINRDGEMEDYLHGESWCYVAGTGTGTGKEGPGFFGSQDSIINVRYPEGEFLTTISQGEMKSTISEGEYNINIPDSYGKENNLPGSRHYRLICYNGQVLIEPCADFRQEVCYEGRMVNDYTDTETDGFRTAACKLNLWQDCIEQDKKKDCENLDSRDCQWINAGEINQCVPLFAPGFDFWTEETDAELMCSRASDKCTVTYERGNMGGRFDMNSRVKSGFDCVQEKWQDNRAGMSLFLGDCGVKRNYLGYESETGGWETSYDGGPGNKFFDKETWN